MRLVIDGHRLTSERTGVGRCLEILLADWALTGLPLAETVVVVRDRSGLARVPNVDGLTARVVAEGWPGLAWENLGLAGALRPDDLLFAPANLTPLRWRGRTVLVIYDTLPWVVPETFSRLARWRFGWRYRHSARRAERIVVPSQATAADVARVHGVPASRLRVVYPGPDPEFRPLPRGSTEIAEARRLAGLGQAPYFLFVGKRSLRRNVPAILDAFAAHRIDFPDHRLVFAGPDDHRPLPGPELGTVRLGHVPEAVLRGLLAGATALLYPSEYEGFGLPVVEAMASGCPVVTLRNSALTEAGGNAAWYLEPPVAESLTRALRVLAADARTRDDHVTRGLVQAARFSRARFASAMKAEIVATAHS